MTLTKPTTIFGKHDQRTIDQLQRCMEHERAVAGALCADGHLGYSMPIGGVIVYDQAISPSGVGYDIACGNMCVRTNVNLGEIEQEQTLVVRPALEEIQKRVAFGVGRRNADRVDHELFDEPLWKELEQQNPTIKELARAQLGTVGSGNHYVDLLRGDDGFLWVANHFGSRGFGHKTATGFLNLVRGEAWDARLKDSEDATVLEFGPDVSLADFYLVSMNLAGRYAYAGREYVMGQVLEILGAKATFTVHNHHNFAWRDGNEYIIRKGATPLTREPAFIGGSMGDDSVIVRGKSLDEFQGYDIRGGAGVLEIGALGSAPHGAGRQMSRTKAAGKMRNMRRCKVGQCGRAFGKGETCPDHPESPSSKFRARDASTAAIDWDAARAELLTRGIVVLGAGADEAPGAYKKLADVIAAHSNVEVMHRLTPLGVVMAGEDTFDPYQD